MIENLVANWLTNVNERGYQIPLCQVLIAEGHRILYVSSHGPGEEGKDIIAEDRRGRLIALQLKGGDIGLSKWRSIRGEVEDLVALPVRVPGVSTVRRHKSILVTNGQIRGDARTSIASYGRRWRTNYGSALEVWDQGSLLPLFLRHKTAFLSRSLADFRAFVELYAGDFRDVLPRARLAKLLESATTEEETRTNLTARRAVEAMSLVAGYIVSQYEAAANHVAACEAWTIVGAGILRVAAREQLAPSHYLPSLELAMQGLRRNVDNLLKEVVEREQFVEPSYIVAETFVYGARVVMVLGWLAVAFLNGWISDPATIKRLASVIRRESPSLRFGGEADWPTVILLSLLIQRFGSSSEAESLVGAWVQGIIDANHGDRAQGVPSPYWLPDRVLELRHGLLPEVERETFQGNSYTLMSALDMLVRRLCRRRVAFDWPRASRVQASEFRPEKPWHWYSWRNPTGRTVITTHRLPRSWSSWRREADSMDVGGLPGELRRHREWLGPFALTFPHRVTRAVTALMEQELGGRACCTNLS